MHASTKAYEHTGPAQLVTLDWGVLVTCPRGHVVKSVRTHEWAHSGVEALASGETVTCYGS